MEAKTVLDHLKPSTIEELKQFIDDPKRILDYNVFLCFICASTNGEIENAEDLKVISIGPDSPFFHEDWLYFHFFKAAIDCVVISGQNIRHEKGLPSIGPPNFEKYEDFDNIYYRKQDLTEEQRKNGEINRKPYFVLTRSLDKEEMMDNDFYSSYHNHKYVM